MPALSQDQRVTRIHELKDKISTIVGKPVSFYIFNINKTSWELQTDRTFFPMNELSKQQYIAIGYENPTNPLKPVIVHSFGMLQFPGCCAFAISTGARTYVYFRKGINKIGLQIREQIALLHGYTGLICSDVDYNEPSVKTLTGRGFKKILSTKNRRTANKVSVYYRELELD